MRIDGLGNKMWFATEFVPGDWARGIKLQPKAYSGEVLNAVAYGDQACAAGVANCVPRCLNSARPYFFDKDNELRCYKNNNSDASNGNEWELPTYRIVSNIYEVSVRVKVCDSSVGLEANCVAYGNNYKPEGLIQQYSKRIRYSIFGYRNYSSQQGANTDKGILRANQKFVGPYNYYPEQGQVPNPNSEWNPDTGVFYQNPDKADADDTTLRVGSDKAIQNSGVINYLNKFGQMNTGRNIVSYDDVSELYYAAVRYFKNQGNVPVYSGFVGATSTSRYQEADAFPVITQWQDPIRYYCQTNVILGIGDTNTHYDKNLPGNVYTRAGEPDMPPEVANDTSVDVVARLKQIWMKEGYSESDADARSKATQFNGNGNSAYIAALAYDSHTRDLRPDDASNGLPGLQTLSTHWVDVVEGNAYKSTSTNQYWLAAKYGGFTVPTGYNPDTNTGALLDSTWWTSGEYVANSKSFKRADNFYTAAEADKMVASLKKAFERIVDEMKGSGSSLSSNSSKLETTSRVYQSVFYSGTWRGDLAAYNVDQNTGGLTLAWNASFVPDWTKRVVKTVNAAGTSLKDFNSTGDLSGSSQAQIDYLRGDRSGESPTGLRVRTGILGDLVNSQPVYVASPSSRLYVGATFTGASTYPAFAGAQANRTPMIYVGANDGMLHAFNANTGLETFAFVPKAAKAKLLQYTSPSYQHQFFVDGELTVADVYDSSSSKWRSILVGTMGRGGRGAFALDVTDPANISLLWDKTQDDIGDLGNNLGKPIIAQFSDGTWYAFLGNGPNSSTGTAKLIAIPVITGSGAISVSTNTATDNGMSGVLAWSSLNNSLVDSLYGGDLKGNMWKITANSAGKPGVASLVFAAGASKPITAAPAGAKDPATGLMWIFFGTGKYLTDADLASKSLQTWYGLIDRGSTISGTAGLNKVAITGEGTVNGIKVRTIQEQPTAGHDGWYMDLRYPDTTAGQQGERMIVPNFFQGTALIGTTRIPDSNDVCTPSGKGFVMAINPFTGGRLPQSFFDLDRDGGSSTGDTLNGVPVSGLGLNSSPNNPIFVGNMMQLGLDNASTATYATNNIGLSMKRVSWRELLRVGQ